MRPQEITRLQTFARHARDARWRVDSNPLVDLVHCALQGGGRFRLRSRGVREGVVTCRLEWLGSGDHWSDVMRDFWCDFLSGADRDLFISRTHGPEGPGLSVVAGTAEHGHIVRIVFCGKGIERLDRRRDPAHIDN